MPGDWVVVQVGPVLQVPRQARFRNKQGWWYVYRRSRAVAPPHIERETDPWGATKCQAKLEAEGGMHSHAKELHMPWRVARHKQGYGSSTVAYFLTHAQATEWKPFATDVVMPTGWGEGANATRL